MFEKTKREGEEEGILFYTLVLYCYTYIVSFVFLNITNVVLYPLLSTLVFGAPTVQHAHTERFEFEIATFEINFGWRGGVDNRYTGFGTIKDRATIDRGRHQRTR